MTECVPLYVLIVRSPDRPFHNGVPGTCPRVTTQCISSGSRPMQLFWVLSAQVPLRKHIFEIPWRRPKICSERHGMVARQIA